MELVKKVKEEFLANEEKVLKGELVGLPWYEVFPKLGQFIPVLPPATQVMCTANSGVGKTHMWIGMILFSLYKLKKLHPERVYKIRFLIALLEDTKEMFITRLYSMLLLTEFGIRADSLTLNSRRPGGIPKNIKDKLDIVEKEIDDLLDNHCHIVDSIYNPTGVYKWARHISNELGMHHYKEVNFSNEDGTTYKQSVYSHYEPNNPDELVYLILDNMNNLQQEVEEGRLLSERETINKWSRKYCRLQITKHWGWSVINVLQQSADSEKPQFDYKGNLVIEKCKPSLDSLGNSKECQRDHILILALFAPNRYGIEDYEGYNIARMKDAYRSLIILKSNISETNKEIPLYFDGAASVYLELPKASEMTNTHYKAIEDRNIKI